MFPIDQIRLQFPIVRQQFSGARGIARNIIYLDHGASTHPPEIVFECYRDFLERFYANIHRGNHYLSQRASQLFDGVSETVMQFVHADRERSGVVFTTNTTMALDVASHLIEGTEGVTLVTNLEHHSNDLPHRRRGTVVRVEAAADGALDYDDLERKLRTHRVRLLAITGASNVTGYMPDLRLAARLAHEHGARILVDAAQLLAHHPVDMCEGEPEQWIDFLAAAGHKAYAPFGSAFLVAPLELLQSADPYIPGGGTVKYVTQTETLWADGAERHSGGTPNIPGVIALGAALDWLAVIGLDNVRAHELELLREAEATLRVTDGVEMLGGIAIENKTGVISFNITGIHHELVSSILNSEYGIATRNGCFCAHTYLAHLMDTIDVDDTTRRIAAGEDFPLPGAVRATIGIYNNSSDLAIFRDAVRAIAAGSHSGGAHASYSIPSPPLPRAEA